MKQDGPNINLYGLSWPPLLTSLARELYCIRNNGRWREHGRDCGAGLEHHMRMLQNILWPEDKWHPWRELLLKSYCENRIIAVLGPASSSKTYSAATFALCIYYANPDRCTVVCTSTTREMLENRVFGEIKKKHILAKRRFDELPGYLLESRLRILSDTKDDRDDEGRDFRNGIQGVATKVGGSFVGLGNFIGIKNDIVILIGDELSLVPRIFVDAIANLNKNRGFKGIAMGNPLDPTDALGVIAEPAASHGGWDGGIDQTGGTKTWPTRFAEGICVQLVGEDCPNMLTPPDEEPPFPFLITRKAIEADIAFYGKDSVQYSAMNSGRMPRGMGSRRVLTRQLCLRCMAFEEPMWKNNEKTQIGFLDAAYGGAGGDRCVFGQLTIGAGLDADGNDLPIMALVDTVVVPVTIKNPEIPEEQIANFVKAQCEQRGILPSNFFFDTTGRGSLMNAFCRLWSTAVEGVEFGGKASDRMVPGKDSAVKACDYYFNRVSELWYGMRHVVESKQFRGLTEEVMSEFGFREWGLTGNNKIQVEPKSQMKTKTGRSPDIADAVVTGVEGALRRGFNIHRKMAPVNQVNERWKEELRLQSKRLLRDGELQEV